MKQSFKDIPLHKYVLRILEQMDKESLRSLLQRLNCLTLPSIALARRSQRQRNLSNLSPLSAFRPLFACPVSLESYLRVAKMVVFSTASR
jgi:hypothetical protein